VWHGGAVLTFIKTDRSEEIIFVSSTRTLIGQGGGSSNTCVAMRLFFLFH
jgi:hypothetical protein